MSMATQTEVKERPILFSAPMVRAILAGQKTMTRRIVKPQPTPCPGYSNERDLKWDMADGLAVRTDAGCAKYIAAKFFCPHGRPGDQLWVKEAWHKQHGKAPIIYAADAPDCKAPKTSPLFLPRRLSRITLEITDVRVQRVQEISEADAWVEGCKGYDDDVTGGKRGYTEFMELWESINGPGSWESNPFVWCLSFKVSI